MLTFATPADETQAAQLMQPCLIRVIDNIRKHTETLDWRSEYLEQVRWPDTATADQRQRVRDLAAQLTTASPSGEVTGWLVTALFQRRTASVRSGWLSP